MHIFVHFNLQISNLLTFGIELPLLEMMQIWKRKEVVFGYLDRYSFWTTGTEQIDKLMKNCDPKIHSPLVTLSNLHYFKSKHGADPLIQVKTPSKIIRLL